MRLALALSSESASASVRGRVMEDTHGHTWLWLHTVRRVYPQMEKYKSKILSKVGHVWNILAHRICHLINSFRCEEGRTVPPQ